MISNLQRFSFVPGDSRITRVVGSNALGEVMLNVRDESMNAEWDETYVTGTYNVTDLTQELGREPTDADFEKVALQEMRNEGLTEEEIAAIKRVDQLQKAIPDAVNTQFRIYGGMMNGTLKINLACEFTFFLDCNLLWSELHRTASKTSGIICQMLEDTHLDHSTENYDDPDKRREIYGENHGRLERQVEVVWDVSDTSPDKLPAIIDNLVKRFGSLWESGGQGVI
jgi:hypothetical protein